MANTAGLVADTGWGRFEWIRSVLRMDRTDMAFHVPIVHASKYEKIRITIKRLNDEGNWVSCRELRAYPGTCVSVRLQSGMYDLVMRSGLPWTKDFVVTSQRCHVHKDGYKTFPVKMATARVRAPQAKPA